MLTTCHSSGQLDPEGPSDLALREDCWQSYRVSGEIVELTGLSQSNVSSHLACLRDCGLVEREARGRFAYYSIANDDVRAVLDAAEAVLARVGEFVDQCENYEAVTRKALR